MNKSFSRIVVCLPGLILAGALCYAQDQTRGPITISNPTVHSATYFAISPPLREMEKLQTVLPGEEEEHGPLYPKAALQAAFTAAGRPTVVDPVLQSHATTPEAASVGINVLGVGKGFGSYVVPDAPTDSNLAVGDTQVVEWVNVSYAVFDKTTGAVEAGPILGNALWASLPSGSPCATYNSGDIIAQWDKVAHVWVLAQNVFTAPYYACFAISTTSDATGSYYLYEFPISIAGVSAPFPDYPKLGIWTDTGHTISAYVQTQNIFPNLSAYGGVLVCGYQRDKMLVGDTTAMQVCIYDTSNGTLFDDSMVPGDLDSEFSLPPTGTDDVLLGSIDNYSSGTAVYEYVFHVDFVTPSNSTLTGINGSMPITVPSYVGTCGFGGSCVPEPGVSSGNYLGSLSDRLMYRLAYHKTRPPARVGPTPFEPVQSWLISHAIETGSGTGSGERWYEFRSNINTPTALTLFQSGTYAPDSNWRWMGSIAMDDSGDILLGYSTSSTTVYPSINFTGRVKSDPLGTMEAEGLIVSGTGSQSGTANRWGDYSSVAIDNNGCTFWYVNQFYTTTTSFGWSTQVASLSFPGCN